VIDHIDCGLIALRLIAIFIHIFMLIVYDLCVCEYKLLSGTDIFYIGNIFVIYSIENIIMNSMKERIVEVYVLHYFLKLQWFVETHISLKYAFYILHYLLKLMVCGNAHIIKIYSCKLYLN